MQITNYNNQPTSFKSVFPVQHWIAESSCGSYALANRADAKILQRKIIRLLNLSLADSSKKISPREQNFCTYMESLDADYGNICEYEKKLLRESKYNKEAAKKLKKLTKVRSFYNRENADIDSYNPFTYIISGKDVQLFNVVKEIGKEKHTGKELFNNPYTPQALNAIELYNKTGLDIINNNELRLKSKKTGMTYVLHTKFERIRNKLGITKNFRLIDARFLPEFGPESPLVKLGYVK